MHILFVHQNFPAQFGHVASYLATYRGVRCSFVSEKPAGTFGGIECIQYQIRGGATASTHYCSRTFENAVWHTHAVFEALRSRPDIRPDLVVGHSGFGSTLYLRELYDCPIINYFEFYYHVTGTDMDFRPDFPVPEIDRLRAKTRNAMLLLDLENCDIGYSPTAWQKQLFPERYADKVKVIFDGIDTSFWRRSEEGPREIEGVAIPPETRVLTYVARGMESMRGFDIFMKAAKRICEQRSDVIVLIAGEDRICYGGDQKVIGGESFKEWVLRQDNYDLSRIRFLGRIAPQSLVRLFSLSDLHIYLTVPFVLSWSMMDALACGATVLGSDTPPVREMIRHGVNGLLVDFFDVDKLVETALQVLDKPRDYRALGAAGMDMIRSQYSLDVCLPRMEALYHYAVQGLGHSQA